MIIDIIRELIDLNCARVRKETAIEIIKELSGIANLIDIECICKRYGFTLEEIIENENI